ncbi:hypothetical protein [Kineosporia corallincola]|nr:hypothetical protein [Kineosporia corallincola]
MAETWEALTPRRNVHSYTDQPVAPVPPDRRPLEDVVHRGTR